MLYKLYPVEVFAEWMDFQPIYQRNTIVGNKQ